jgi:hypothetical protein
MYSGRAVKTAIIAFLFVHALVIFIFPLLPFIDLPNHLAEATIYKYGNDPGLREFYQPTPWWYPNTFHAVFCSLFPDVEMGNRIFHMLCIVLLLGGVWLVINELGGNPWYGLLASLFTYNYNFTYGFVGFAISIPMVIVLFYLILLDIRRDTVLLKILIAVFLVLIFLMHAQNALFALLLYGLMMLYCYRKSFLKLLIRGFVVPLPLVILIFAWWFTREAQHEGSTGGYLLNYYTSSFFSEFAMRFRLAVFDNFQLQEGWAGILIATGFFACVFIPLLSVKVWRNFRLLTPLSDGMVYAGLLFATAVVCYLFLPDKLPGQTPLFQRFCTIVILSFIILASLVLKDIRPVRLPYFVCLAIGVYSVLWIEYICTFNRENKSFNKELFANTQPHARLAGLIYDTKYRGRKVYIHYPNYFIVWKRGIAASKIIDYRFGVVRRSAPESKLPFYNELIGDGYRPMTTYSDLEYLLVRGSSPQNPDKNLKGFSLNFKAGAWSLYRNTAF